MTSSQSRSRSRSRGNNRRGGSRRSPQEKGSYQKSGSRSGSRGRDSKRNDSKRRNKFSDSSNNNGGGSQSQRREGGFSSGGGFADSTENFRGDRNSSASQQGGSKGPSQSSFGGQPRSGDNNYNNNNNNNNDQNGGNSGAFSYTNVRNHHNSEGDRGNTYQKQDSGYNRSIVDRASGNSQFQSSFVAAGSLDNYRLQSSGSGSLRQGGFHGGSSSRISRKVFIPQDGKFNYIGLIIGPKGSKQKQLEEMTSCKILIRGKGSQKAGQPPQPDDNEDLHVLIEADSEANVTKAMREIENIIFMDDDQKVKMRDSQLKSSSSYIGGENNNGDSSMRQLGGNRPTNSERQTFIQIPNNCVGLVIGRKGETIKQIKEKSGADKVYMQPENQRNTDDSFQNLIVEGSDDSVEKVRELINDIQNQQKKKSGGGGNGSDIKIEMEIPANLAGLIIGKQGSTLQQVGAETKTRCQIQQNNPDDRKILIIMGQTQEDCQRAKEIFEEKMNRQQNGNNSGGRYDRGGDQRGGFNNNRGGFNANRGGAGGNRFNNRRPRKNADDDEIVDDNQFEYYPTYNVHEQMMQNQQMLVNMQQQMYQQPYSQYPQLDGQQQQVPQEQQQQQLQQQQEQPQQTQQEQQENNTENQGQQNPTNVQQGDGQNQVTEQVAASGQDFSGYQQQQANPYNDQMQMQMQIQQYLQYQQMLIQTQAYSGPVIEEVLEDGTVVSVSQNDEDKKKGKRGGRR